MSTALVPIQLTEQYGVRRNQCTGQCCQRIVVLGLTYQDIREKAFANPEWKEIQQLRKMLHTIERVDDERYHGDIFACKNWDPETRLCKIYETRPNMCRIFPYDMKCRYCGMTRPDAKYPDSELDLLPPLLFTEEQLAKQV
jgi:Fe-S-cluster containining protein